MQGLTPSWAPSLLEQTCLLTNLHSCFDQKCDYRRTRDNKSSYLLCSKEHEFKKASAGALRGEGEGGKTAQEQRFTLSTQSPLLVKAALSGARQSPGSAVECPQQVRVETPAAHLTKLRLQMCAFL